MQNARYPESYYAATANPAPERPALEGEKSFDICIVGAGYSGLVTGLFLAEKGYKVAVLESEKVGWGASGRNGGQLINGYSRGFDDIKKAWGAETAAAIVEMSFDGADILRDKVKTYDIKCDLKSTGSFFAAYTPAQMKDLEHEKAVWERFGHTALELVGPEGMAEIVDSKVYCGGMLDRWGGHMHPLNLALGEAAAIEKLGGTIFENSRVTSVDYDKDKPEVHTARGKITADFVVICGNGYLDRTVPELRGKVMPVSSQVITTEILGEEYCKKLMPPDFCIEDCNYILDYYRITGDHRLLFGGGIVYGGETSADIESSLRKRMVKVFPELEKTKIDYAWSGTMAFTFRRMPHIGRLSPGVYFVQGYSGHGVTPTHLVGKLLAEAIAGQSAGFDVFASLKHYPFPGGRMFRVPLTVMGAWFYALREKLGL
ncbi:MAG: FAD-binding oxidoreductase [Micavibrio sp.]|nr:MAG: FAD-binding oxidoreductase [Micavibrio sp.]